MCVSWSHTEQDGQFMSVKVQGLLVVGYVVVWNGVPLL